MVEVSAIEVFTLPYPPASFDGSAISMIDSVSIVCLCRFCWPGALAAFVIVVPVVPSPFLFFDAAFFAGAGFVAGAGVFAGGGGGFFESAFFDFFFDDVGAESGLDRVFMLVIV